MLAGWVSTEVEANVPRLGVRDIATLDRRHFTAVWPRHIEAFTLLSETLGDPSGPQIVRKKSRGTRF